MHVEAGTVLQIVNETDEELVVFVHELGGYFALADLAEEAIHVGS